MTDATNVLATQGVAVLLIPLFVQWLKKTPLLPWINQNSSGLNRTIAWTLGLIAAAGVHYQADLQLDAHLWRLTIDWSGVTWETISHTLAVIGGQLGGQQLVFNTLKTMDLVAAVSKVMLEANGSQQPAPKA